jgi:hypothetical protein
MCRAPTEGGGKGRPSSYSTLEVVMSTNETEEAAAADAVGIVVQDARPEQRRPRVVAFVYGGELDPQPSLPYGRWKSEVRPAA